MAKKPDNSKAHEISTANMKNFAKKASSVQPREYISTGHLELDLAIAHGVKVTDPGFDITKYDIHNAGGFPRGRMVELSGPEGSGKSSLAYRVVGNAQKTGLRCLWIDAEFSFSDTLAQVNGVNLDELELADLVDTDTPEHLYSAEEIFDRITDACVAGYNVIVLDSVANLSTKAELDNYLTEGGVGMGALATALTKGLRKIVNYAAKYNCLVIVINQMREKIGILFGNPESTPGGHALKHLESVRIRIKPQGKDGNITQQDDEGNEKLIGGKRNLWILKNRFAPPFQGAVEIPMYYTYYFPDVEQLIFDEAYKLKIITRYKGEFRWGETIRAMGKIAFVNELKSKEMVGNLVAEVKAKAEEEKVFLAPEVVHYEEPIIIDDVKTDDNEIKVSRKRKTKNTGGESSDTVAT